MLLLCRYCGDIMGGIVDINIRLLHCSFSVVILSEVCWCCAGIVIILVLHCDDIFSGVLILQ